MLFILSLLEECSYKQNYTSCILLFIIHYILSLLFIDKKNATKSSYDRVRIMQENK